MKIPLVTSFVLILLNVQAQISEAETDRKVNELLGKMTLEEKAGQMAQITLDVITHGVNQYVSDEPVEINPKLLREAIQTYKVGSVLNTANNRARTREIWQKINEQIQIEAEASRLKIPVIYGIDAVHGTTYTAGATFFPQQIGMAASFNPQLVQRAAEITAYETRASNIPWNFSPVLDMGIDARNARMWETFGEDPYLAAVMGEAMVTGYEGEGENRLDKYHVASCLKHFLGYGYSFSGKDRTPAFIPENSLREIHLPGFQKAIEAGSESIMVNSGIINGIPVHASRFILTGLLKEELNFKGVVVTDWADIENLHNRDKVAESQKEAVKMAINAGIDMSMIPYNYDFVRYVVELVNEGEISQERIDDAVKRILRLKFRLGLFEKNSFALNEYPLFGSDEFIEDARKLTRESITLLENKNSILPLRKGSKILVTGPNANSMRTLNGGWSYSWQGEKVEEFAEEYMTVLEALQAKAGPENVLFEPGVSYMMEGKYYEESVTDFISVISKAAEVDYIILVLGENSYTEKPGDLDDLDISQNQQDLALTLAATGKPVILVLNEGRPRLINGFVHQMQAVIQSYLPGNYGGEAIADVIFGDVNPSGKLPYSYPKFPNALINYNYKPSENQEKMEGAYDYASNLALQYEFGHGMSYTTFEYSDLEISSDKMDEKSVMEVKVKVKNTGARTGKEVVMLFTKDHYASITPDVRRLRKFEKTELQPGEEKTIAFTLNKDDISFINSENQRVTEPGKFSVLIGNLEKTFTYK